MKPLACLLLWGVALTLSSCADAPTTAPHAAPRAQETSRGLPDAADATDAPANLALGLPYQVLPAPDHKPGPTDVTDLTDGAHASAQLMWNDERAVTWNDRSVTITLDLGAPQPISGASFSTAGHLYGVELPSAIDVLVSDDGAVWHEAGNLVRATAAGAVAPTGYVSRTFRATDLTARGRFIQFIVVAIDSCCIVTDEIEVYRGPDALLSGPILGEAILDAKAFAKSLPIDVRARRRMTQDATAIRTAVVRNLSTDISPGQDLLKSLDELLAKASVADLLNQSSWSTRFPIHPIHGKTFEVQGALWRALGLQGVVVWQSPLWDMLEPTAMPQGTGASVDVAMMRGEYRSAAINVSNAGTDEATISLHFEGAPGGDLPPYISVFEVPFTDTIATVPVATALVSVRRAVDRYEIAIPPGMTKQVWMIFHSISPATTDFGGRLLVQQGAATAATVPVQVKVSPLSLPAHPTLHVSGWDYTDGKDAYDVTPQNREALVKMLQEYGVDSTWARGAVVLGTGTFSADGRMTAPPDPTAFRHWVGDWRGAANYLVYMAEDARGFAGLAIGGPAFGRAVDEWARWWEREARRDGLQRGQLHLLLVDEPKTDEQAHIVIQYASIIRAAAPMLKLWENPRWPKPTDTLQSLAAAVDELSPHVPDWMQDRQEFDAFYAQQRQSGRTTWVYSTDSPSRLLDPYAYYRLQAWLCWQLGAAGSSFWAFSDAGGASSWQDYASPRTGGASPLFLDDATVTSSKHMEAIREGLEDYEYLRMLDARATTLERESPSRKADGRRLRTLLVTSVDKVLNDVDAGAARTWTASRDRTVADVVRRDVLDALVQ